MRPLSWALLLILLAPAAFAQTLPSAQPQVSLALSAKELRLNASNESAVYANVTNGGALAGTASLTMGDAGGWNVRAEPRTFPIAAGRTQMVVLYLTAPAPGSGPATTNLAVSVSFSESNTQQSASAQGAVALVRVDPPPPPPPPFLTPARIGLGVGALALVAALVVVLVVRRRKKLAAAKAAEDARLAAEHAAWLARETGITIEIEGALLPWGLRRELLQRVRVRNASERPRVAQVGVRSAPPGWIASVSLPRFPLSAGESALVTVYLNPSHDVPGGEATEIVLYAKPEEAQEKEERVALRFEAPPIRIPRGDEATTIALRDGAPRPALRR